jgi:hypothetical protein
VGGVKYAARTYIINNASDATRSAIKSLGLNGTTPGAVSARQHSIRVPRIALMHSWLETQNAGWMRYALDQIGVPYTYISDQSLRVPGRLDKFDVVVFPHVSGNPNALVNGRPMVGPPIPWKKSALTPNIDLWDQTDDIRSGMELEGAAALRRFVERGGLLLTSGNSSVLPITLGFNPTVTQFTTTRLNARGISDSGAASDWRECEPNSLRIRELELSDLLQSGAGVQRDAEVYGVGGGSGPTVRAAAGDAGTDDSQVP